MSENELEIYYFIGYVHLLVIGAIGNGFIVVYFVRINQKNLQRMTPYHFLLTSLAVIDISVSIGVPILYLNQNDWLSNKIVCKYVKQLLSMPFPSYSVWILVIISYERYRKMVYPFIAPLRKKILIVVLVFTLVMCIGCNVPMMESNDVIDNQCFSFTKILNSKTTIVAFYISSSCFDCLIPLAVILWFYYKISVKVKHFDNTSKRLDQNHQQQLQNYRRKRVALKTLRTLIIMYVAFVFPGRFYFLSFMFLYIYDSVSYLRHFDVFSTVSQFMQILVYLNNIGNVFIYAWLIVDFRQFLKKVFTFGLLEKRTAQNPRLTGETRELYVLS